MKQILYKLTLCTLLLPLLAFAENDVNKNKGKFSKEKIIKKDFSVASDALLKINNSYGTIHMTSWDQNTVAIEVVIKTQGDNEEKVAEQLQRIDVDFSSKNTMVAATTNFQKNNSKSWWKWSKRNDVSMTVNYTVKFPKGNRLHISNDYGGIMIDKAENNVILNSDYGRMEIGELLGNDNTLNFDYSSNTTIAYMKSGRINADYSSFTIQNAGNVKLYGDHTKSVFGKVENITYACDYNTLQIAEAKNVNGTADYLSLRLGKVSGNVEMIADYGSIKIAEMTQNAGNIRINSEYTGIKIGYHPNYNFDFEFSLDYAGLKGEEAFTINERRTESRENYYKGYHGVSGSGNSIKITSEYGSVRLDRL